MFPERLCCARNTTAVLGASCTDLCTTIEENNNISDSCVAQDIQISAEEGKRLPLNFLMVKAMHDRELLATTTRTGKRTARNRGRAGLSPRDRTILRRSAHYARFAAASYDGVVDTVKDLVAEGDASRPPNLLYQTCV